MAEVQVELGTLLRLLGSKDVEIDRLQTENQALRQQVAQLAESITKKGKKEKGPKV